MVALEIAQDALGLEFRLHTGLQVIDAFRCLHHLALLLQHGLNTDDHLPYPFISSAHHSSFPYYIINKVPATILRISGLFPSIFPSESFKLTLALVLVLEHLEALKFPLSSHELAQLFIVAHPSQRCIEGIVLKGVFLKLV